MRGHRQIRSSGSNRNLYKSNELGAGTMATPRDDPNLLKNWLAYRDQRLSENGVSLQRVSEELAREHGCGWMAVRQCLDPSLRQRQRRSNRLAQRRRYARVKYERLYNRNYHRLTRQRSQAKLLHQVFSDTSDGTLVLPEVVERLPSLLEGVQFKRRTIEKGLLRPYAEGQRANRIRGPPYLLEIRQDVWYYGETSCVHGIGSSGRKDVGPPVSPKPAS